jgi:transketolase
VRITYTDDVVKRMEAYNWHVQTVDGHNYEEIQVAIEAAQAETEKPSFIVCKTKIGFGSPNKEGTHDCHGAPLGEEEVVLTKKALGISEEKFFVPQEVRDLFAVRLSEMKQVESTWNAGFAAWRTENASLASQWDLHMSQEIPADLMEKMPVFDKALATRSASGKILQELAKELPFLVGGSADLAGSNMTHLNDYSDIGKDAFEGRNFHYGVREIGMGAIMNGIQVHGGFRIYGATFMVFADYVRPTLRVAALMGLPVIYVLTHDSFWVGEDGPTHQPIETISSLRMMPNVTVIRPSDPKETACAWNAALKNTSGPTILSLTRQNLEVLDRKKYNMDSLSKGAYTMFQSGEGTPDLLMIATGSEVKITLDAAEKVAAEGTNVRVVSMPCRELFEAQDEAYQSEVMADACSKRMVVEAGTSFGWEKYIGRCGATVCKDTFGASAPGGLLAEKFGFSADNVYNVAKDLLG